MPNQESVKQSRSRRAFIKYLPLGIFAGVFGSLFTAAFRFLRPVVASQSDAWVDVADISELSGASPIPRKIATERSAGWTITTEEHNVFVLPAQGNQVLSATCPHEGCEVMWESQSNAFSCPCHESYFAADGAKIKGPSRRGLDPLPTRTQGGKLQVQYRSFENNSTERTTRA